jgi:hypothetical protein
MPISIKVMKTTMELAGAAGNNIMATPTESPALLVVSEMEDKGNTAPRQSPSLSPTSLFDSEMDNDPTQSVASPDDHNHYDNNNTPARRIVLLQKLTPNDVLFHDNITSRPGNQYLMTKVLERYAQYHSIMVTDTQAIKAIATDIVHEVARDKHSWFFRPVVARDKRKWYIPPKIRKKALCLSLDKAEAVEAVAKVFHTIN